MRPTLRRAGRVAAAVIRYPVCARGDVGIRVTYSVDERETMRVAGVIGVLTAILVAVTGCAGGTSGASTGPNAKGPVTVLYPSSLGNLMQHHLGPAFQQASGDTFHGLSARSDALVTQIKNNPRQADVFISADPAVNNSLVGVANGNRVSWYVSFASAPLVIGYNPNSTFAGALKSTPWYQAITDPGFTLGGIDPQLDPLDGLALQAFTEAAKIYHDPGLPAAAQHNLTVLPEPELVSQLKSGHLDAGFLPSTEAAEQNIPTISLDQVRLGITYTVTVLNLAPDPAPAAAFVRYLLSPASAALLKQDGLAVLPLTLYGYPTAIPPELRSALPRTAANGPPGNSEFGGQSVPRGHR